MKKIEAIIRREKYEEVKAALKDAEIQFFSFWDVRGCGQAKEEKQYRGNSYDTSFIERRFLSIVVNDNFVDVCINAIIQSGSTGEIGDGKIFISTIDETVRIRNGERGPEAIYFKG